MAAATKSDSTTTTTTTTTILPIQIIDDDDRNDDDDDISLVYSIPPPPPPPPTPPSSSLSSPWLLLGGNNVNNAISVENYNYNYHSYRSNSKRKASFSFDEDAIQVLDFQPPLTPSSSKKCKTTAFTCEICADERPTRLLFNIQGCTHSYCSHCVVNYISSRLQDNIVQIRCPVISCPGLLEPYDCSTILPPNVLDRWGTALCESTILDSHKFYCPFKDCSALLLMDDDGAPPPLLPPAAAVITQSECPYCRRLFCVQCKVPWHNTITCEEFQGLGKNEREREDIMLMKLAKNKKWMRCSRCKFYVEKTEGCLFMRCRCGHKFCYNCGATSVTDHYCANWGAMVYLMASSL